MIENLNDKNIKKVDLSTRTIYLNKAINSDSIEDAILAINDINTYDNEQESKLKEYTREPIKVIVDSYGGSVYDGLGLVNIITSSKTPVHTYCYSKGMSMGLWIFISGHKRFIHENAYLMFHQLSSFAGGTNQDILDETKSINALNNRLMKIVRKRTNITNKQIKKKNLRKIDWFISGKKALKLNAADELIEDTV